MASDWEQLKSAFIQAAELSAAEQQAFLAEIVARDPELGAELATLLKHDTQDNDALSEPISQAISELVELPLMGQSLGAYVLVDTIATGGMGTVYRGRRNDAAFEQDVAIKVMSQLVASEENLTRFRSERQILAQLSHPHIAEIFDGGTTGQGLPYLVMEYIDGQPIDIHCRSLQLDDRARIELFLKVCDAVSLAHQNLIVHRDIKPSNVLVSTTGIPKLLDFGIAKPIGPARIDLTHPDLRAMTPQYASPEQVRGEPVTTQTDVYALGLLLYQMLSDKMPYATTGLSAGELEKSICETDPAPLTRTTDSSAATPRRFRVTPDFAADLNTIVMCALQKDASRRYPSVSSLVDDINNFLRNEPIAARPDSTGYRAKLFWRRHRLGVSISALALLTISVFTGYTYQQAVKLAAEKSTAERSLEFLTGMFRAGSPTVMNSQYDIMPDMKVSELLDLGASRVYTDLADQPLVQARLLSELGDVYSDRGNMEKASELLNDANARLLALGEAADKLAESRANAGWLLVQQTRYAAADTVMMSAYELLMEEDLAQADAMIKVATDAAVVKAKLADYTRAHELYQQAIDVFHHRGDADPTRLAAILHNQSWTYWLEGRFAESETAHLAALEIWQEHLPADHPTLAVAYDSGAGLAIELHGDVDAAEALYQQVMAIDGAKLGENHPEYARDLLNYALLLELTGRIPEARATNQQALDIINSFTTAADYEYRGTAHQQLADNARLLGDFAAATRHMQQFSEIAAQREQSGNAQIALLITAAIAVDQADYQTAQQNLDNYRPADTRMENIEYNLLRGAVAAESGNQVTLFEALAALPGDARLGMLQRFQRDALRARVDYAAGQHSAARADLQELLGAQQSRLPDVAPLVIDTQLLLARWLMEDDPAEARTLLRAAHQGLLASGREHHPLSQQVQAQLE